MANLHEMARRRLILNSQKNSAQAFRPVLPETGLMIWEQVRLFVPFSRRSLTDFMRSGKFPRGQVFGNKLVWRAETIRAWIDEVLPLEYSLDGPRPFREDDEEEI